MPRFRSDQPTEVELEILQVLWDHEPCALGRIHEMLAQQSERAYSTTRKMVQVMREKGLITCDESVRPQIYSAAESRERTVLGLLDDLVQRAFGGNARKLVMSLLSAERVTTEEVREMQRLLEENEEVCDD